MKSSLLAATSLWLGLALAAGASAAQAQDAGAAPADATVKKVGDWTITCTSAASQTPCEMSQGVADKTTGQRLLTMSFIYLPSRDQSLVVIVVPLGIAIPQGIVLQTDAFTSPKIPYHHCDRNGCYAEVPIDKGTLQTMGHTSNAMIKITDPTGKGYNLRLSLNGFADANDALDALAKQKAKSPPPAPAPAAPTVIK